MVISIVNLFNLKSRHRSNYPDAIGCCFYIRSQMTHAQSSKLENWKLLSSIATRIMLTRNAVIYFQNRSVHQTQVGTIFMVHMIQLCLSVSSVCLSFCQSVCLSVYALYHLYLHLFILSISISCGLYQLKSMEFYRMGYLILVCRTSHFWFLTRIMDNSYFRKE